MAIEEKATNPGRTLSNTSEKGKTLPENSTRNISKQIKTREKSKSVDNWEFMVNSFLKLTTSIIEKIQGEGIDKNRDTIIPLIYNFKHAIEICIKYLALKTADDFDFGHDSSKLIEQFLAKAPQINQQDFPIGYDACRTLFELAKKYTTLGFLQPKFGNYQLHDGNNELFKYPEGKVSFKILNYNDFVQNITLVEIKEIKEDIEKLKDSMHELISHYTEPTGKKKKLSN